MPVFSSLNAAQGPLLYLYYGELKEMPFDVRLRAFWHIIK